MGTRYAFCGVATASIIVLVTGISHGCSTACDDCGTGGGGQPPWPTGWDRNGQVVRCNLAEEPDPTTGGGPTEGVTCISNQSIWFMYDSDCNNHGLRDTYIKAICAKTFGGVPSDYSRPQGGWIGELDDYPTSEHEGQEDCDVMHSFSETEEIPVATDATLLSTGEYDRCSRESYCATLAKIIDEFPGDGILPDPWCNVSPGGESETPGPWRCVGSSSGACGRAILESCAPNDCPICPVVQPGDKDYCVIASSETEASEDCEQVCLKDHTALDYTLGVLYTQDLECEVFDDNVMVWVSDVVDECYNVDYEITTAAEPFVFTADLLIDGGANASSSEDANIGFIDYRVENCVGLVCDIVIDGLELAYMEYGGTLYDDEENPYSYSVEGVSIHLVEPVRGTVTSFVTSPPVVEFPAEIFELRLSTGNVMLDTVSLGAVGPVQLPVNQVTGTYGGGVLALQITYETVDATMLLTLTTF